MPHSIGEFAGIINGVAHCTTCPFTNRNCEKVKDPICTIVDDRTGLISAVCPSRLKETSVLNDMIKPLVTGGHDREIAHIAELRLPFSTNALIMFTFSQEITAILGWWRLRHKAYIGPTPARTTGGQTRRAR
jgi:hypothetical protein